MSTTSNSKTLLDLSLKTCIPFSVLTAQEVEILGWLGVCNGLIISIWTKDPQYIMGACAGALALRVVCAYFGRRKKQQQQEEKYYMTQRDQRTAESVARKPDPRKGVTKEEGAIMARRFVESPREMPGRGQAVASTDDQVYSTRPTSVLKLTPDMRAPEYMEGRVGTYKTYMRP